jgi:hypothetical protein
MPCVPPVLNDRVLAQHILMQLRIYPRITQRLTFWYLLLHYFAHQDTSHTRIQIAATRARVAAIWMRATAPDCVAESWGPWGPLFFLQQ